MVLDTIVAREGHGMSDISPVRTTHLTLLTRLTRLSSRSRIHILQLLLPLLLLLRSHLTRYVLSTLLLPKLRDDQPPSFPEQPHRALHPPIQIINMVRHEVRNGQIKLPLRGDELALRLRRDRREQRRHKVSRRRGGEEMQAVRESWVG